MRHPNSLRTRFMLLAALSFSSFASSAGTVFSYASAPGDYIGGGASQTFTPVNAKFTVSGSRSFATVFVEANNGEFWSVDIASPDGTALQPGKLYNVERAAFRTGRSGGLDVSGAGRGCNEVWGEVGVRQVEFDAAGKITSLEASFTQRCERNDAPPLSGVIRYQAKQLSLRLDSDEGDYIGRGNSKTYYNDTSVFGVQGSASGFYYFASGERDDWFATISSPQGRKLKKGIYRTQRFSDATHAGLDFTGNGAGCNESDGTLRILSITTDAQGNVASLAADFEQHCEGNAAALRGNIRYGY